MNAKASGFTLLELMIVVVVISILAAIAYPSYSRYAMRAHRADGKELAMRIASAEERYFTNMNRYTVTLADIGITNNISDNQYYSADVQTANSDQTFVLTLTPQAPQDTDKCGNLTINNTGFKDHSGDESNGKCW